MTKLLALVTSFILSTAPVQVEDKEYVAVFGSKRLSTFEQPLGVKHNLWDEYYPTDYILYSEEFEDLDVFLATVRRNAGNRPIVIDIECHGDPMDGLLHLESHEDGSDDAASMGYLVKKIDHYLGDKDVTVTLEACFSRFIMESSLDPAIEVETPLFHIAKFNKPIDFPIYGIGLIPNYNNFIYAQYEAGIDFRIEDLRRYRHKPVEPVHFLTDKEDADINEAYTILLILQKLP